ncbi:MAG TPA: hypothetical protein VJ023_02960 [Pyrinomonadaceae bacterium]|nr:hypothetical protein [Pyrinomonadaceae bacterium]
MSIRIELTVKRTGRVVWIAICLSLFQIGIASLLASPGIFPGVLLSLMLILSFPSSLPLAIAMNNFMGPEIPPIAEFSLMWACMFFAGYLQWFVLIPWLARPRFTTLGLSSVTKALPEKQTLKRRRRRVRKRLRQLTAEPAHHDANGLTPFERVISHN